MHKFTVLGLILFLAVVLRVIALDKVPPALFGDEIDVGYQAYSLLKTGKDLYGNFLPLYIHSLAEYRTSLFIYSSIPFVAFFGLNEWGVRLTPAFWGIASILGIYLLVQKLFSNRIGLICALMLSISPWHIQYSRASFEVTMLISFIIFGVYFFILGIKNYKWISLSAALFALTLYIYSTAVVFVPFLVTSLLLIYNKQLPKLKHLVLPLIIGILVLLPFLYSTFIGKSQQRFGLVSIFQESVLIDKINIARTGQAHISIEGEKKALNPYVESLFHNKPIVFTQVFGLNYLRAFSFSFLFGTGDPNFRHSIAEMGQLYFFEIFLIILGISLLIKNYSLQTKLTVILWLLLAPIPASLTTDGGYHATRLILMLPMLILLSALGIEFLIQKIKFKHIKIASAVIFFIGFINISLYFHRYYFHYPVESWRWWQVGYKEMITYIKENEEKYDKIVLNNTYEPTLERLLFYTAYNPAKININFKGEYAQDNIIPGIVGFTYDNKYYFGRLSIPERGERAFNIILKPGMLMLASERDDVEGILGNTEYQNFRVIKTVVNPVGDPIMYLIEGK